MTAGQHIDYDAMALEALRGVVKACLAQVARTGLLGDHHFYIAFNTQAPGVGMSKRLKEKYPQEMTIVLQHRFWDLAVEEDRFEVKLTFDGIPERLVIPFNAIKVFYDPSVPYGLQFEESEPSSAPDAARRTTRRAVGLAKDGDPRTSGVARGDGPTQGLELEEAGSDGMRPELDDRRRPVRRPRSDRSGELRPSTEARPEERPPPEPATASAETPSPPAPQAAPKPQSKPSPIVAVTKAAEPPDVAEPDDGASGAKIFDLSKFRGKK
ncbi:MAG: ClpXP protease specificity-enhancing factor SspB [Hyphomicrobiaceae bacterium]|nr:ClpXP protease specificity-enhancing factor SspB [Hyphomicrobiaceae bacterium]